MRRPRAVAAAIVALWACALGATGCAPEGDGIADDLAVADLAAADLAVPDLAARDLTTPDDSLAWRLIAEDTFQRPDQASWGVASDGQAWGSAAAAGTYFAIASGRGELRNPDAQPRAEDGVLGPVAADVDVLVTGGFGPGGDIGSVVRWQDAQNLYKILLDGNDLIIEVRANGQIYVLGGHAFPATSGSEYNLRCQAIGGSLMARAWPVGQPEPADWLLTVSDPTFATGRVGIRGMIAASGTDFVSHFVARQLGP